MKNSKKTILSIIVLIFILTIVYGFNVHNIQARNPYILSSRWFHPRDKQDKESTIEVIEKLNPERIDWIYYESDQILQIYKEKGLAFSLTLNPQIPDSLGYTTKKYRIVKYNGVLYVAPWMKNWKSKNPNWGCVNNPLFYKIFVNRGLFLAEKGSYGLMVDDALFNAQLKNDKLVGCFCNYCIEKFNRRNKSTNNTFNLADIKNATRKLKNAEGNLSKIDLAEIKEYEDFQEESVVNFLQKWKGEIVSYYPKMTFLTNNSNGKWNKIYSIFDGGIAELDTSQVNADKLTSLYLQADKLNKTQLFTCSIPNDVVQMRLLEYNLKNNRKSILPWDVFVPAQRERYYMNIDILQKKVKEIQKYNFK